MNHVEWSTRYILGRLRLGRPQKTTICRDRRLPVGMRMSAPWTLRPSAGFRREESPSNNSIVSIQAITLQET